MTNDRGCIFEKLAQLENWTDQLGQHMDHTAQAIADTRRQVEFLAEMMDSNARHLAAHPEDTQGVMAYLETRRKAG